MRRVAHRMRETLGAQAERGRRLVRHPRIARRIEALYPERLTLFLFALAGGALWAFLELADEVVEGSTAAFDERLILLLRNPQDSSEPLGPPWLEEMMRDFTGLGGVGFLTLVTLCVIGFLLIARKPKAALAVALAIGAGLLISTLLKSGFDRPRPDLVPYGSLVYTASFPSGHSLMSATVMLTLGTMLAQILAKKRLRFYVLGFCVLVTILVGVSRVYLGVHWPTDVLAGWLVGGAWAVLCASLLMRLQIAGIAETGEESEEI
jgi:undecaprenyl-diphosphatase